MSDARRLRLSEEAVREILDRLDSNDGKTGSDRRKHRRHRYRMKLLVVELPGPSGIERHEVPTRDLSRHGMSFLSNRFIYKGTRCRVRLISEFNVRRDVEGEVMRCRYVQGTSGIHEVGIRFDNPIDIALFHREGASSRVLLLDEDVSTRALWTELFRRLGVEATVAESPAAAQDQLQQTHFDLVLVHADASTYSPCDFTRKLRTGGYLRPIMTFSTRRGEELVEMCRSDQCTACRAVPLNRESLQQVTKQLRVEPLVSSLSHDASMATAINAFVASLPGFLKQVEELAARKAYAELTPLT